MSDFSEDERKFIHEFMGRTLNIVKQYEGSCDATLLLNCLLGLLVVPKEKMIECIPTDPIDTLQEWGINPRVIKYKKCECGGQYPTNLRQLVQCMRHAVAHFNIEPINKDKTCIGFRLSNRGFRIDVKVAEMKTFVERLSEQLKEVVGPA